MNWMLIAVMLLLIWEMMRGCRRGFLRTVYSLVSWFIAMVLVMWMTPYIETFWLEHTALYATLEQRCAEEVRHSAGKRAKQTIGGNAAGLEELGLKLPEGVWNDILEKTGDAADEFLENSGIYDGIASGMAGFIVEGISFFCALTAAWILVHAISRVLGIVSKIPVIHGINRLLGIFAGGLYGLILVWIVFYLIALGSASEWGMFLASYIYQNPFLQFLYENNPVISVMVK